jgi:thiamine-phosphate pyrophosphorylase
MDGGASLIQIRDKSASSAALYKAAVDAVAVTRKSDTKIIINDRVDIALAAGADGVHLGQDDLPPEHARKILGPDAIIGLSTHSRGQARAAQALPIDYIAIGPIFSTSTKDDTEPVVGLEELRKVRSEIGSIPLVAIGGINGRNVASVWAGGADSAAMIGEIMSDAAEITARMRKLLQP